MSCNPAIGRVDIVERLAYKTMLLSLEWNEHLSWLKPTFYKKMFYKIVFQKLKSCILSVVFSPQTCQKTSTYKIVKTEKQFLFF